MPGRAKIHIHFLLLPNYADLSLSSALETLQCFNSQWPDHAYRWSFGSSTGDDIMASVGTVFPSSLMSDMPKQPDTLILVSGLEVEQNCDETTLAKLRRAHREGASVIGLSTGAFVLAKAGLLRGNEAAIHWKYRDSFAEIFPQIPLAATPFIFDGRLGTTAGGVAAIDLMLDLIAMHHGEDAASKVAYHMNYSSIRALHRDLDVSSPHFLSIRHPTVRRIIANMENNIEDPLCVPELARSEAISTRQLERLFKRHLQCSPNRFYISLRLSKARRLLIQTDMTVTEIAVATGFSSMAQFSKHYRHSFGTRPSLARSGLSAP